MSLPTSRVAIITGASRGIGRAISLSLAQDGYVTVLMARSESTLQALAEEIKSSPWYKLQAPLVLPLDVSDAKSVADSVTRIFHDLGRVDVLVNNAGINIPGTLELSATDFQRQLAVNLGGAFNLTQTIAPLMRRQKSGHIINISSIAGKIGFAGAGGYCASKFGLLGLNDSLFHELVPLGIKVTALCPSWINTDMAAHAPFPREKMIKSDDIVKAVRFLLSLSVEACIKELVIEAKEDLN